VFCFYVIKEKIAFGYVMTEQILTLQRYCSGCW